MAQHTQVLLVDDIDGSPAQGTVDFGLDGQGYAMELSAENDKRLRAVLGPYIEHGRRIPATRPRRQTWRAAVSGDTRNAQIREWAKTQPDLGPVNDRGRVSKKIIAAYDRAHGS
jgi:hypothetical protein